MRLENREFHRRISAPHSISTFVLVCQFEEVVLIKEEVIKVPEEAVVPSDDTAGSNRILA